MSFRAKIIFIVLAVVALVAAILWVLFFRTKAPRQNLAAPNLGGQATPLVPSTPPAVPLLNGQPVTTPRQLEQYKNAESIKVAAKNFVERFGSYSAAVNFVNFDELRGAVTDSTWEWLKSHRLDLAKQNGPDFVGVTTRVLSVKIISQSDQQASVSAATQREETRASGRSVIYRDMLLKMVAVNKQWLVDGAYWQ